MESDVITLQEHLRLQVREVLTRGAPGRREARDDRAPSELLLEVREARRHRSHPSIRWRVKGVPDLRFGGSPMRRLGFIAVLLSMVSLATAPSALAQEQLHISPLSGSSFPKRSFALTLPKEASLNPSQVRVRRRKTNLSHLARASHHRERKEVRRRSGDGRQQQHGGAPDSRRVRRRSGLRREEEPSAEPRGGHLQQQSGRRASVHYRSADD